MCFPDDCIHRISSIFTSTNLFIRFNCQSLQEVPSPLTRPLPNLESCAHTSNFRGRHIERRSEAFSIEWFDEKIDRSRSEHRHCGWIVRPDNGCRRRPDSTVSQFGARRIASVCTSTITRSGALSRIEETSLEASTQVTVIPDSHSSSEQRILRLTASGSDTKTRIGTSAPEAILLSQWQRSRQEASLDSLHLVPNICWAHTNP